MKPIDPRDLILVTGGEDCDHFFEQSAALMDQHDKRSFWPDFSKQNAADHLALQGGQCKVRNLRASRSGNQR